MFMNTGPVLAREGRDSESDGGTEQGRVSHLDKGRRERDRERWRGDEEEGVSVTGEWVRKMERDRGRLGGGRLVRLLFNRLAVFS